MRVRMGVYKLGSMLGAGQILYVTLANALTLVSDSIIIWFLEGGMSDDVLNHDQAAALLGISRRTLFRRVDRGAFPQPRRLTPQATYWLRSDLEAYLGDKEDDEDLS